MEAERLPPAAELARDNPVRIPMKAANIAPPVSPF